MTFGHDQCPRCSSSLGDRWTYTFYGGTVRSCSTCGYPVEWGDREATHDAFTLLTPPNLERREVPL